MRIGNSWFKTFSKKHQKSLLVLFFISGFIWDSLTLGRVDRLYDIIVLCSYMIFLTISIYLYNLADDGKWKGSFIERIEAYLPFAIQFFIGGLSSAFVIYFSRSVSVSKTMSFFLILLFLLFANEVFKKRLSNKYLQFSIYFFVNFIFFSFFLPVLIKKMNTSIFLLSGVVSLANTLLLIVYIYSVSPSTRAEIKKSKMLGIILGIYLVINLGYYFNLIPPVPLALETGMAAHSVTKENGNYVVSYETDEWYIFWRDHRIKFLCKPGESVYIFSSIFAPTDLIKSVSHRWNWLNPHTNKWEVVDNISYDITGGRDAGFRGYTYKDNTMDGKWRVDVITEEELVLGIIDFEIETDSLKQPKNLVTKFF